MNKQQLGALVVSITLIMLAFSCCSLPNDPTYTTTQVSGQTTSGKTSQTTDGDLSYLVTESPDFDNSDLPITPINELHQTGFYQQDVGIEVYRLIIDGLVNNPLSLAYDVLKSYPAVTETVLLICPQVFVDNATWTGVPVAVLLAQAGLKPGATGVTFYSLDGYRASLSLSKAMSDGVFLAYAVDGQVLPAEHGYPLRLVARGEWGGSWAKWVDRIEVT